MAVAPEKSPRINNHAGLIWAHDQQAQAARGGRWSAGHRLQRVAALHRRRGLGESEIRRWIIENDWLEGIVALPDQLFYNTGISTYFWIVTNRKGPERLDDGHLVAQARANPIENFRLVFNDVFIRSIVGRMDDNAEIFKRILDDPTFQAVVMEHYLQRVFEEARASHGSP